jgi:hypothetical protein
VEEGVEEEVLLQCVVVRQIVTMVLPGVILLELLEGAELKLLAEMVVHHGRELLLEDPQALLDKVDKAVIGKQHPVVVAVADFMAVAAAVMMVVVQELMAAVAAVADLLLFLREVLVLLEVMQTMDLSPLRFPLYQALLQQTLDHIVPDKVSNLTLLEVEHILGRVQMDLPQIFKTQQYLI